MSFHKKDNLDEIRSREPQTPAQIEAAKAKAKLSAVKLTNPPWLDVSEGNLYEVVVNLTYGMKIIEHDPDSKKIQFLRYDADVSKTILDTVQKIADAKTFPVFVKYFKTLEELAKATLEAEKVDREARTAFDNSFLDGRDAAIAFAEQSVAERRADQLLQAGLKQKPKRVFTEADEQVLIHTQVFELGDLERSHGNLSKDKAKKKKETDNIDKKIANLAKEIEPFDEKISALQAHLAGDLTEERFKDLRLSLEYNQMLISKIQDKISPLQEEKAKLQDEIEKIDKQAEVLNCVVDKLALERESVNWQNRRKRALERVYKVVNDQDGLIQLRISLNEKWKLLTGDSMEFIPPLALKSESELFFL